MSKLKLDLKAKSKGSGNQHWLLELTTAQTDAFNKHLDCVGSNYKSTGKQIAFNACAFVEAEKLLTPAQLEIIQKKALELYNSIMQ